MKILIDTNVIIDIINHRQDFFDNSFNALKIVFEKHCACVSTITIADTVYITKKVFPESKVQQSALSKFFAEFKICRVGKKQIKQAFNSPMSDFEDAVQSFCAKSVGAKLILTRNVKDYKFSPVKAIMPVDFLEMKKNE